MSSKAARKRKRQERRRDEMSLADRVGGLFSRYLSVRKLALLGIASAAVVGAVFLVQLLSGSATPGKIIDAVLNERTQGIGVSAAPFQVAPNFEAQDLDGNIVRLSDFQGSPVILNFWATWCTACRAEIPALQRVFEERRAEGLEVLGVDWGERSVGSAQNYMNSLGATYLNVMDPTGKIGDEYRVFGLPVTLAIDKDGVIVDVISGELNEKAFDQMALLAMGSIDDLDDDIGPVGEVTTREDSAQ